MMNYPETKNKVVALVATGYRWKDCVFGLPGKDYWTLNNMYRGDKPTGIDPVKVSMFDEWFQLHRPGSMEGHVDDEDMRGFLATNWKKPCWVQKDWGVDMAVINPYVYPIDEVVEYYCPRDINNVPYPYFTNSVDYMICMALLRGYEEIHLYGVEFISLVDNEYYTMRQSINYYLGQAKALGVKVVIQPTSSMLRTSYWYAYENPKKDPLEKIMEENLGKVEQQKAECQERIREQEKLFNTLDGGGQALKEMVKISKLKDRGAQI